MPEPMMMPLPLPELRPNPDPTDRTVSQLQREIGMLQALIGERLDGYDKAIDLLQKQVDREPKPPVLESQIKHTSETLERLSANIEVRFAERDKRIEQRLHDNRASFEAGLTSIKETFVAQRASEQNAINKSEAAALKQMDQIESKFGTEIRAIHTSIADLKDRMTSQEQIKVGMRESKTEFGEKFGYVIGAIGALIAVVAFVYSFSGNGGKTTVIERERPVVSLPAPTAQ